MPPSKVQDQAKGLFVDRSVKLIVSPTQISVVLAVKSATGGVLLVLTFTTPIVTQLFPSITVTL